VSSAGGDPDYLVRSTYTEMSGLTVTDVTGGGSADLLLNEIGDLDDPSLRGSNDAFRLELSSTDAPIPAGIRTLSHPDIGQFDVFMSPVGMPGATMHYEVIVDRVVPVTAMPPADNGSSTPPAVTAPAVVAPSDATPGAPSPSGGRSGTGTAASTHTVAHESAVTRVGVHRHGRGVIVDVALRPGVSVSSVRVRLEHNGHRLIAAGATPKHGVARVTLQPHHRLAAGQYAAVVTADVAHGAPQISRYPVELH
jgi:hypothetical protein